MLKNIAILIAAGALLSPAAPLRASVPEMPTPAECDADPKKARRPECLQWIPIVPAGTMHKVILNDLGPESLAVAQDRGADINGTHDGDTPLTLAVRMGRADYVSRLISRGAHVDAPDAHGRAPLLLAVAARGAEMAGWLLREGANPNRADKDGTFPLYLAAAAGWPELVDLLVQHGAHVDARHSYADATALEIALLRRRNETREILIAAGASRPIGGWPPSVIVRHDLGADILRAALAEGADPNRKSYGGRAALHIAASAKRLDYLRALLHHGADPDARDPLGATPLLLLIAANPDDAEGARALVNAGADTNLTRNDGVSPLLLAVEMGRGDLVEALIAAPDADLNVRHPQTRKTASALADELFEREGDESFREIQQLLMRQGGRLQ